MKHKWFDADSCYLFQPEHQKDGNYSCEQQAARFDSCIVHRCVVQNRCNHIVICKHTQTNVTRCCLTTNPNPQHKLTRTQGLKHTNAYTKRCYLAFSLINRHDVTWILKLTYTHDITAFYQLTDQHGVTSLYQLTHQHDVTSLYQLTHQHGITSLFY